MRPRLVRLRFYNWCTSVAYSPSRSFAVVAAAFCVGIVFGMFTKNVPYHFFLLSIAILIITLLLAKHRPARVGVLIAIALLLGMFRYGQAFLPDQIETVADRAGQSVRIDGTIDAEVDRRLDRQQVILDHVLVADEFVEGKLLVSLPLYPEVHYGDHLVFNGTIEVPEPFNGFAYDQYLQTKGVLGVSYYPQYIDVYPEEDVSVIGSVLAMKESIINRLQQVFPEPHASFLSGLLFGGSSSLSADLKEDFSRTGASHILAASGFNVSLFSLVFLGWILQTPLGRKRGLLLTATLLVLYVITAGGTPAVVRAAIMASVLLLGKWIRRKAFMTNILLLTLALMLFVNPLLLFWDVGFQLSFVATTALIVLTPKWEKVFLWIPDWFGLRQSFVASLAAIVCTLPIILWQFGTVSLIAPFTNLLLLPLIPYTMALSMIALVSSLISTSLATIVTLPAWAFSSFILHIIVWFGSLSWASVELEWARGLAVVVLIIGCIFASRVYKKKTYA